MRTGARVLIALIVLAAAGALVIKFAPKTAPATTAALFAASFPDEKGQVQALEQWRGQVVVLNFWATWCPPCREEMPEFSAFQDQYRAQGLAVLGLSTDDAVKIRQFAQQTPTTYPLLVGEFEAMSLAESLGNSKGILPYTVLIQRDGSIAATYFGRIDMSILERDARALIHAR